MAKIQDNKIEKTDIEQYLNNYSDFSFEVKVLKTLTSLGFNCKHSGTYEDPITKKTREFDIRAWKISDLDDKVSFRFGMAVECKNIRENFPLVVHCMPRAKSEAFNDLVWSNSPTHNLTPFIEYGRQIRLEDDDTIYTAGGQVGKSCDQVGRRASQNGEITSSDSDVFDKISQSLNSMYDMLRASHYAGGRESTIISFVLPVLVVPKDRIWAVSYDFDGNIINEPNIVSRIPYYIGKSWKFGGTPERTVWYHISHLEIVEIDFIKELIELHSKDARYSKEKLYKYFLKESTFKK
jgi:hypothetical protein